MCDAGLGRDLERAEEGALGVGALFGGPFVDGRVGLCDVGAELGEDGFDALPRDVADADVRWEGARGGGGVDAGE